MQDHIDNLSKLVKDVGMGAFGALDSYIIYMIETDDKRRALIDIDNVSEVEEAMGKEIEAKITKVIKDLTKGINIKMS